MLCKIAFEILKSTVLTDPSLQVSPPNQFFLFYTREAFQLNLDQNDSLLCSWDADVGVTCLLGGKEEEKGLINIFFRSGVPH